MKNQLAIHLQTSFQGSLNSEFVHTFLSGDICRKQVFEGIDKFVACVEKMLSDYKKDPVDFLSEKALEVNSVTSQHFSSKHFYYHAMQNVAQYVTSKEGIEVYVDLETYLKGAVLYLVSDIRVLLLGGKVK